MLRYLLALSLFTGVGVCQASPSAKDILGNYSKNRSAYDSFIAKCRLTQQFALTSLNEKYPARKGTDLHQEEFRFDGVRGCWLETWWGHINGAAANVPESNPWFRYELFANNGREYWYGRANNSDIGQVNLGRDKLADNRGEDLMTHSFDGSGLLGYFYGDNERIDKILRDSPGVTVRDKTEQVGGRQCYIVDAKTDRGQYTLWMDPERGYCIAKATVARKAGDKSYGTALRGTDQVLVTVSNVKLVDQNGVWVPAGGDIESRIEETGKYKLHQLAKVTEMDITINPNHDALGSFDPNTVIRSGAMVNVFTEVVTQYIWQEGGKLVPYTAKPAARKPGGR
jgi:hypothetical protein